MWLTLNGQDFATAEALRFRYFTLELAALTPVGGPAHGGTTVVISGAGLAGFGSLDTTLCRFGSLPAV